MALLDLIEISKTYETNHILDKVDFSLHEYERVAIIGKNGGGKSTLMKIIHGSLGADEGRRIVQKNIKIGMLDQTPAFKRGMSVKEAIEKRVSLKDKTIAVRGKVVKASANILERNFIHIQDGTSDGAEVGRIVFTSKELPKVGDIVTARGVVSVDKNFGSGYVYKIIVEDATFTK